MLHEARGFAQRGYKEVVLTGIHLTSYGDDHKGTGLAHLIREIHAIEGIERIRLGSLEPLFLTMDFIQGIKSLPKLCPHFHISLQSGCEKTLKRMNRKYTPEDYRNIAKALREHLSDVTLTTDIMVGFPGETQEDFMESYRFCEEMNFLWAHVFKYSPRKGTPAARYPDQVDAAVKEQRSRQMISLAEKQREKIFSQFLGQEMPILLEQPIKDSQNDMEGLTANYIPVAVEVENRNSGEIIDIRLMSIEGERMRGSVV